MDDIPSGHHCAGQQALEVLRSLPPAPDKAGPFHDLVEQHLRKAGFVVRREAYCAIREFGMGEGRIDLLAQKFGGFVAIELDRRSPRAKSMDKLRAFNAFRIVVLRGDRRWGPERDIDAIISVPVAP